MTLDCKTPSFSKSSGFIAVILSTEPIVHDTTSFGNIGLNLAAPDIS